MPNVASYGLTSVYQEDISTGAGGTELIGHPATIWELTVCIEGTSTCVVSFSNTITAYDTTYRSGKVVIDGPGTHTIVFPKGMPVTTGLCAISNLASVDVQVAYE